MHCQDGNPTFSSTSTPVVSITMTQMPPPTLPPSQQWMVTKPTSLKIKSKELRRPESQFQTSISLHEQLQMIFQRNSIQDCPVTLTDIKLAEKFGFQYFCPQCQVHLVFYKASGSSLSPSLKGTILDLHKEFNMPANVFHVNQIF